MRAFRMFLLWIFVAVPTASAQGIPESKRQKLLELQHLAGLWEGTRTTTKAGSCFLRDGRESISDPVTMVWSLDGTGNIKIREQGGDILAIWNGSIDSNFNVNVQKPHSSRCQGVPRTWTSDYAAVVKQQDGTYKLEMETTETVCPKQKCVFRVHYSLSKKKRHIGYAKTTAFVHVGPGTSYAIVDTLKRGQAVRVDSIADGWYLVSRMGARLGFVDGSLFVATKPGRMPTAQEPGFKPPFRLKGRAGAAPEPTPRALGTTAESGITAVATETLARFVVPVENRSVWRWNLPTTGDNVLEYKWQVELQAADSTYEFGFSLSKYPAAAPAEGDLASLLRAGQASVWLRSTGGGARVLRDLVVTVQAAASAVVITVQDRATFGRLFSARPAIVAVHSLAPGGQMRTDSVRVVYAQGAPKVPPEM